MDDKKPSIIKKLGAPFTEFFDAEVAAMKARRAQRESDAIKRTMASDERVLELRDAQSRGLLAKQFVEGAFWKDHLLAWFRSESVLKPAAPKDGAILLARSFIEYLVGSGKVLVLAKLLSTLDQWQSLGEQATRVLAIEAEKRRRVGA